MIKICDGTACHVRGSNGERGDQGASGASGGKNTTDDMRFTVETVSCLGARLAPVVMD